MFASPKICTAPTHCRPIGTHELNCMHIANAICEATGRDDPAYRAVVTQAADTLSCINTLFITRDLQHIYEGDSESLGWHLDNSFPLSPQRYTHYANEMSRCTKALRHLDCIDRRAMRVYHATPTVVRDTDDAGRWLSRAELHTHGRAVTVTPDNFIDLIDDTVYSYDFQQAAADTIALEAFYLVTDFWQAFRCAPTPQGVELLSQDLQPGVTFSDAEALSAGRNGPCENDDDTAHAVHQNPRQR
eukprot:1772968-Rhodomonas_salina.2